MEVGIAYREDVDEVVEVLREIGEPIPSDRAETAMQENYEPAGAWNRQSVRSNHEPGFDLRPGANVACILVAVALTGGYTGTGDRDGKVLDSGRVAVDVPMATAPARTVEVTVEGVDGSLARNVHAHLSLAKEECDAPRWRVERFVERAADEAREAPVSSSSTSPDDAFDSEA